MVAFIQQCPRTHLRRPTWQPKSDLPREPSACPGFRYYSPEMGRWLNRDPIEEEGGAAIYVFCENAAISRYDVLGQRWRVRRVNEPQATATVDNNGGTLRELANRIGLAASEFQNWLVSADGARVPPKGAEDTRLYCRDFKVPNTVTAYWGDAEDGIERLKWMWLTEFPGSITYFRLLGFHVEVTEHRTHYSQMVLHDLLDKDARDKVLHGVYFVGHGVPAAGILTAENRHSRTGKDNVLQRKSLQLAYRAGLAILMACHSQEFEKGDRLVPSAVESENRIFHGYEGYYWGLPPSHVVRWIHPGQQETRR